MPANQPCRSGPCRSRVRPSRRSLAALAVPVLLAAAVVAGLQLVASADPATSDVATTCSLGTTDLDVNVPMTVDDVVDPVEEGGSQTLHTESGAPSTPVVVTIDELVVTTAMPTEVASVDAVAFSGGNMAASYEVQGRDLVVTFTGPVQSDAAQIPKVTAELTVGDGIGPTTIEWKPFTTIVADTNYGVATCSPNDPDQVLNTTEVVAGGPVTPPTEPPAPDPEPPAPEPEPAPPIPEPEPQPEPPTPEPEPQPEPPAPEPQPEPPTPEPSPCLAVPELPSVPAPPVPGVPELPARCPPVVGGGGGVGVEVDVEVEASITV